MAKRNQTIAIWPGTPPGQPDPTTHFWYESRGGGYRCVCDDARWPGSTPPNRSDSSVYVPCAECRNLYVEDIVSGELRLDPSFPVDTPSPIVVPYPKDGGYPVGKVGTGMEIKTVPMTAFARFYGATAAEKVRVVRDSRLIQSDPRGYKTRDYYGNFRNALKQTHWATDDIGIFEAALDSLVEEQLDEAKQKHYRTVGEAYIELWKKRDAHFFQVPPASLAVAGLNIRVVTEVGMQYQGDRLALKLHMAAPRPTRQYRQAIQYLTEQGRRGKWPDDYQPLIWDVRRTETLPPVAFPRDIRPALEGQAVAFQQIWDSLDAEEE